MVDINPSFKPYPIKKPLPMVSLSPRKPKAAKGKMRESLPACNLLDFFGAYSVVRAFLRLSNFFKARIP
jgi:hypothetical protein